MNSDKTNDLFPLLEALNTKNTQEKESRGVVNEPNKGKIPDYESYEKDQNRASKSKKRNQKIGQYTRLFVWIIIIIGFFTFYTKVENYAKKYFVVFQAEKILLSQSANDIELRNTIDEINYLYLSILEKEQRATFLKKQMKKDSKRYENLKLNFNKIND